MTAFINNTGMTDLISSLTIDELILVGVLILFLATNSITYLVQNKSSIKMGENGNIIGSDVEWSAKGIIVILAIVIALVLKQIGVY